MSRDVTGYCAFHAFAGTEAERETCEDCHAMQKMGERMFQPPATPQEPEPYGPFFDPCGKCVTRTHCAHHDRCLAECVPADLRASTPSPEGQTWQPIETAPKDTAVLLWLGWRLEIGHFNTGLGDPSAIVEAADSTLSQLFDFSARLAAVEAERDNLKGAMAADDARLRAAGERVDIQFGSDTADWMAEAILSLRAERDRLKAALSKITALDFEKFNGRHNFYSGAVMFVKAWLLAYAALTPHQGQSTDGETR